MRTSVGCAVRVAGICARNGQGGTSLYSVPGATTAGASILSAAATREFDAHWVDPTLFVTNVWPGLVERARELGVSIV